MQPVSRASGRASSGSTTTGVPPHGPWPTWRATSSADTKMARYSTARPPHLRDGGHRAGMLRGATLGTHRHRRTFRSSIDSAPATHIKLFCADSH